MTSVLLASPLLQVDAVLDSPVVDYLPHLLDTYPNARLILTHRDPAVWAQRRALLHPCSPPPFAAWYGHGALSLAGEPHLAKKGSYGRDLPCRRTPAYALQHALLAWSAYVEALASASQPPKQLLHIDVYRESDEKLWRKLRYFIDRAGLAGARKRRRLAHGPFGCDRSRVGRDRRCRQWRNHSAAPDANVSHGAALLPFWSPVWRTLGRRNKTKAGSTRGHSKARRGATNASSEKGAAAAEAAEAGGEEEEEEEARSHAPSTATTSPSSAGHGDEQPAARAGSTTWVDEEQAFMRTVAGADNTTAAEESVAAVVARGKAARA